MRRFHTALGLSFACAGLMSLVVGCATLRLAGMANSPTLVAATSPPPSPALLEAIRTSLSVEAWRFNRGWTAEAEWESRGQRFPAPSTLRWSFGKNAEAVTEKPPFEDLRISKSANRGKTNPKASQSQPNKSEPAPKTETAEASNTATQSDGAADPKSADAGGDENSVAWDGFWPLTVSDLVHRHEHREGRAAEAAAATVDDGMRCLHRLARVDSLAGWNAAILWGQHDPQSAVEIVDVLERLVIKPPLYVAETGEPDSGKPEGTKAAPSTASKDSNAANDAKHKAAENPPPHRPTRRIAPATQAAAAEAWCLVLSASAGQAVDGLAPAGRALERVNLPNSVRGEVFRGVSAWVPPAHIPRLENALRQGEKKTRAPADIRQAAIEGCLIYAINRERADQTHSAAPVPARAAAASKRLPSDWPSTVMNCRIDPDFQVRRTFIQWLGRARPDGAFELLKTQAESAEVALRAAALESLGRLHTEAAHAEIKSQADKTRDTLRAAAVGALSGWGIEEVAHYA
ncbi:MAG TPA: HEAT repeat domain-containing protein, partial [Planctomycetaceae bacterium]|nr:HEAT repeat domain-containing protein [Planctomycetaceae bacterium]